MGSEHSVYYVDRYRSFAVVNDGPLDFEPITPEDLALATIDSELPYASWAWSSGLNWYFVIGRNWIALFNINSATGVICRKKSAEMIRLFLDDPMKLRLPMPLDLLPPRLRGGGHA